ncbi:probable G-protein coupled receptor 21 [Branchiostoma lanceolatum]|uniref:probable G-protein coupled receptor 21 n=1 Tax=Branchiostoma lanceolatum TaxID=7740 RepID=UPI0034568F0D
MNFSNESFTTDLFAQDFFNDSFTTSAFAPVFSPVFNPAEPAVIITEAVLSITGNFIVLAVTTRRQTFPSASRLFISSMAWSDLLLGSTFPFMVAPAEAGEWVYSDTTGRVCAVIGMSSMAITASALAGLNLDRLYVLTNNGEGISVKKARTFLISTWAGIYAFYIFSTVYGVPVYYDSAMALIMYDLKTHMWFTIGMIGISSVAHAVTMHCVVRVLRALCAKPSAANANPQQQQAAPNYHSDSSYAKVVLILTLVQTAMSSLLFCALMAILLGHDLPTFLFWSVWGGLSNTFLNVIVSSVSQESFRNSASCLYRKLCNRNRVSVDQDNIEMSTL